MGQSTFKCDTAQEWNRLPSEIRELNSLSKFKTSIFKHYMDEDRINHVHTMNLAQFFACLFVVVALLF